MLEMKHHFCQPLRIEHRSHKKRSLSQLQRLQIRDLEIIPVKLDHQSPKFYMDDLNVEGKT